MAIRKLYVEYIPNYLIFTRMKTVCVCVRVYVFRVFSDVRAQNCYYYYFLNIFFHSSFSVLI